MYSLPCTLGLCAGSPYERPRFDAAVMNPPVPRALQAEVTKRDIGTAMGESLPTHSALHAAFRYLVRFGIKHGKSFLAQVPEVGTGSWGELTATLGKDFALENPTLDADGSRLGHVRSAVAVLDVGTQGMQGDPPLAVPSPSRAISEPPRRPAACDPDALGAELHGDLKRPSSSRAGRRPDARAAWRCSRPRAARWSRPSEPLGCRGTAHFR